MTIAKREHWSCPQLHADIDPASGQAFQHGLHGRDRIVDVDRASHRFVGSRETQQAMSQVPRPKQGILRRVGQRIAFGRPALSEPRPHDVQHAHDALKAVVEIVRDPTGHLPDDEHVAGTPQLPAVVLRLEAFPRSSCGGFASRPVQSI